MKIKKIGSFILFTLFFIYLFIVFDAGFHGPDEPIYLAYTASMIEDGDLNAVKHLDRHYPYYLPSNKIPVSKTYNLPDLHNHGGIVLWAPFYAYAKTAYAMARKVDFKIPVSYRLDRIIRCAMSFSTVVFAFFTVVFTYMLTRAFFPHGAALWSTAAVFFGTPFFYFTLKETGNANIIAGLFSVLSIWFCAYAASMRRIHWFLYGLFFSICVTVKVDLWFQLFLIIFFFTYLLKNRRIALVNSAYFVSGLLPGLGLKMINDYLKYGTFHVGEFGLLNLKYSYFFDMLFSPYRGYFYTSPVLYICLLGAVFLAAGLFKNAGVPGESRETGNFILILASYVLMKIFFISYSYAWGGGTTGARILLTEFPVFVLLYSATIQRMRGCSSFFAAAGSIVLILWNFMVIGEYMSGADKVYAAAAPALGMRIKGAREIFPVLFSVKDIYLKLCFLSPLLLAVLWPAFHAISKAARAPCTPFRDDLVRGKSRALGHLSSFAAYVFIVYVVITVFNMYNNKKNVEILRAGGFFNAAVVLSPEDFEKQENAGSLEEMIEYFTSAGDHKRADKIKRHKIEKYGQNSG